MGRGAAFIAAATLTVLLSACVQTTADRCATAGSGACARTPAARPQVASAVGSNLIDDRVVVDATRPPWRAIGRIQSRTGGECTAVLVSRRVILTAAHCMFEDRDSPMRVQIDSFVIGRVGQHWTAEATVIDSVVPPDFDNTKPAGYPGMSGRDYAFAVLDRPLGRTFGYVPVFAIGEHELDDLAGSGKPVLYQAGYSADSINWLSAHLGCRVLSVGNDNTIITDCDVLPGDSGSPVMVDRDGEFGIIGVMSTLEIDIPAHRLASHAVDTRAFYQAYVDVLARYP